MLDKTFIPGNILTANELNDLVDGLNNVDVRIGEQFQCCCDEEIKPALLGHIANQSIHQEYSDIVAMVEKKISEALKNFNKGDDAEEGVIYATEDFAKSLIKDWVLKSDFDRKMSDCVLHSEFDPIIADIRKQIEDLGKNPGIDPNDTYALKSDLTALRADLTTLELYANATFVKHSDLEGSGFVDADYVANQIKNIPKTSISYSSARLDGYNKIALGIIQQDGKDVGTIYAPTSIINSNPEDGDKPENIPSGYVREHYVVLYSNNDYDRLIPSLYDSEGNPKGDWDPITDVFTNPNSSVWNTSSSGLTGTIYFTTRVFYSDRRQSDWSTPALFVTTDSFVSSHYVQIYAKEENGTWPELNKTAGSYSFKTHTLSLPSTSKWTTSLSTSDLSASKIYYTWRTFYSDGTSTEWHMPPVPLITSEQLKEEINSVYSQSRGVAVYAIEYAGKPTRPTYDGVQVEYVNNSSFTLPKPNNKWWHTISDAIKYYRSLTNNTKYKIWVSYNNFILTYEKGELANVEYLQWTDPVEYVDIDNLLTEAAEVAQNKADAALSSAEDAVEEAKRLLAGNIRDLKGQYDSILGANGETIQAAISGIVKFYEWKEFESHSDITAHIPKLTRIIWGDTSYEEPTTFEQLNDIQDINLINKWCVMQQSDGYHYYAYVAESLAVVNQVAQLEEELNTVREYIDGKEYKVDVVKAALDTDEVTTSMIDAVAGNISLVVAHAKDGSNADNKAVFDLSLKNGKSDAILSADQIRLDGDVITAAIKTKEININGKTHIKEDGTVLMGQGTNGASKFEINGNGSLAGGLIQWGAANSEGMGGTYLGNASNQFVLKTRGHIEAYSGYIGYDSNENKAGWLIGNVKEGDVYIPALVGRSENSDGTSNELQLTTNYIGQQNNSGTYGWRLNSDGTAILGDVTGEHIELFEGNVSITGNVCAESGYIGSENGWNIGNVGEVPVMYSEYKEGSNVQKIVLSPQELYSSINDRTKWQLSRNGSGNLANGNITWNTNGDARFKGIVKASGGEFIGHVTAESGSFTGEVHATSGSFSGKIDATDFRVLNADNKPTMELTTIANAGLSDSPEILKKAGLENADVNTPIILVTLYNGNKVTNKYIVNLTNINQSNLDVKTYEAASLAGEGIASNKFSTFNIVSTNGVYTYNQSSGAKLNGPFAIKASANKIPMLIPISGKNKTCYLYNCDLYQVVTFGNGNVSSRKGWFLVSPIYEVIGNSSDYNVVETNGVRFITSTTYYTCNKVTYGNSGNVINIAEQAVDVPGSYKTKIIVTDDIISSNDFPYYRQTGSATMSIERMTLKNFDD